MKAIVHRLYAEILKSVFKDDPAFRQLDEGLAQVLYYASLSNCCQILEGSTGKFG